MGDWHGGGKGGKGAAERAGGIALHDQQTRPVGQQRCDGLCHCFDMGVVIRAAGAMQLDAFKAREAMIGGIQRVLSGENQARLQAATVQCGGYGRKLDGFWTGPDNEVDTRTMQPSP